MDFTQNTGSCCMTKGGCNRNSHNKLSTFDWMSDLSETQKETDYVEVQFKNTRKSYFFNNLQLPLEKGDMVAVEASPGHDIGEVTLTGRLVLLQMKKNHFDTERNEIKKIYRKAKENDLEKYQEAKNREQETMIKARQIAEGLNLNMKIGDVEFQGDGNKAIFYYIADERVDFRQLIKVFAETFRIRIEMKQIGARQEAGRIGGIGSCGRELCCSGWMTNFNTVTTNSARQQDISLNPQKLAGQCGKLKCCMNFEVDNYQDALKDFPSKEIPLETMDNTYYHFKSDTLNGLITYSTSDNFAANLVTITAKRAKDIIALNKIGAKPDFLEVKAGKNDSKDKTVGFDNVIGQDSLTRFDVKKKNNGSHPNKNKNQRNDRNQRGDERNNAGQPLNLTVNKPNNKPNQGNPVLKKPQNNKSDNQTKPEA